MARKRTAKHLAYHRDYMREYLAKHREYRERQNRLRYIRDKDNPEATKLRINTWHRKKKAEVLQMFGNCCSCCGESRYEFMCLDHIHGGGKLHRKRIGTGGTFWNDILNDPDARLKYRILCHNCNMARGFYGYCPHEKEEEIAIGVAC